MLRDKAEQAAAAAQATAERDVAAQRFRHLAGGVLAVDSGLAGRPGSDSVLSASDGIRAALDSARTVTRMRGSRRLSHLHAQPGLQGKGSIADMAEQRARAAGRVAAASPSTEPPKAAARGLFAAQSPGSSTYSPDGSPHLSQPDRSPPLDPFAFADLSDALARPVRVLGREPCDAVVEGGPTPMVGQ